MRFVPVVPITSAISIGTTSLITAHLIAPSSNANFTLTSAEPCTCHGSVPFDGQDKILVGL